MDLPCRRVQTLISLAAIEAVKADGFLRLRLPKAASETVSAAIEAARAFFRLPITEKLMNRLPDECAFTPMGIEYSASPATVDVMETFRACVRTEGAAEQLPSPDARRLHAAAMAAAAELEVLAEQFAFQLARACHGDPTPLVGAFHRWSEVQLNYALPHGSTVEFINELHEDGNFVTIGCTTGAGLEIRDIAGTFIPLTVMPPEVLLMPAEIAMLMSGGAVQPLYHRVRRRADVAERITLLFNGDLDPAACTPWARNHSNHGVNVGARVLANAYRFGITPFRPE